MQDAESFIAVAQGMKNVVVTEIKSAQIVERKGALNLGDVLAQEQAIPGIAKMHSLMEVDGKIETHIWSKDSCHSVI